LLNLTVTKSILSLPAGLIYIKELDWYKKQGEFAYCIGYEYGNKSLISQSIKALSKLAFKNLGIETLQIIAHKTNVASVKVAGKNNFKWVKTLKEEYTPQGEKPLNMELFELYNER
jgi:ribosomal-protein-alanine N-acetyltransferase